MDVVAWWVLAVAVAVTVVLVVLSPQLKRDHRRRQLQGGGGSMGGLGAGLDAVWRPSADEAHAQWQAAVELPAPAPAPGDKGRMEQGRIVIEVSPDH